MIVAGHHVFGAEVQERANLRPRRLLQKQLVAIGDAVGRRRLMTCAIRPGALAVRLPAAD